MIDLYHPQAHSEVGIREQIISGIDPTEAYFVPYRRKEEEHQSHLAAGLGGKALEAEREALAEMGPERAADARSIIEQVAVEYCVDLDPMLETPDSTLGI